MPAGDRTGPWGYGPRTGRERGFCAGYPTPGFMTPGIGGRGYGRGGGFGMRMGRGNRWFSPYLPSYPSDPRFFPSAIPPEPSTEELLRSLEAQKKYLEESLHAISEEIAKRTQPAKTE